MRAAGGAGLVPSPPPAPPHPWGANLPSPPLLNRLSLVPLTSTSPHSRVSWHLRVCGWGGESNLPSPPSGLVDKGQGDHLVPPEWGRGPKGPRRAALWRQREPAGSNCITLFHRPPFVPSPPKPQSWQQAGLRRSRPNNLGRCEASRRREQQGYLRVKRVALPFSGTLLVGPSCDRWVDGVQGWPRPKPGRGSPAGAGPRSPTHPDSSVLHGWKSCACASVCVAGERTCMP